MQELLKWIGALALLGGFALTMGGNPTLYGATLDMLARRTQWRPRLIWMTSGLAFGATVLFVLFLFINPESFVSGLRGRVDHVLLNEWIDLAVAALLLIAAAGIAVWKLRAPKLPVRPEKPPRPTAGPASYFLLGTTSSVIGFTTLPIMYLTGRVITGLSSHLILQVIAYVIFLAILVAPYFAIGWLWTRFPDFGERIAAAYARALHWDYRWAVVAFLVIAAVVLIVI